VGTRVPGENPLQALGKAKNKKVLKYSVAFIAILLLIAGVGAIKFKLYQC